MGQENTTVTFWTHTHPPMVDLNKELIAEYEEANPHVKIEYQTIPNSEFFATMLTSLNAGSGPDVINMSDSQLRGVYIPRELVAPIVPEAMDAETSDEVEARYIDGALSGASDDDGAVYGLPSEFNAVTFAINTQHFEEAGLDPDNPPTTWDEVGSMGQQLVVEENGVMTRQGFNFLYLHSSWYMDQIGMLMHQTGGRIYNDDFTESIINEPEAVEALEIWNTLINELRVGDPNVSSREATAPLDDFANGRTSMNLMYPWSQEQIKETNPETYEHIKVVPLPQVDPGNPTTRLYAYYWAVNAASKQQEEAWKFVSFLASHGDRWLEDVNFVQPVQGWNESEPAQRIDFIDTWSEAYETGRFDEVGPDWSEISDIVKRAIEETIFSQVPPQQSLDSAKEAIDQIIKR